MSLFSVVVVIIIVAIPMVQKAFMFLSAHLHAKKKANYFRVSANVSMVVRILY